MLTIDPRMASMDIITSSVFCVQSYQQQAFAKYHSSNVGVFKKSDHIKAQIHCTLIFLKSIFYTTLDVLEWKKSAKKFFTHHVNVELLSYGGIV